MSKNTFAEELLQAVRDMRAQGRKMVQLDRLETLLQQAVDEPEAEHDAVTVERYRADLKKWTDDLQRSHEIDLENFKAVIAAGQNTIRTALLINGGAAVAMLAFVGNLAAKTTIDVAPYAFAMLPFTFGVLTAGLMSGGTYLTQWFYGQDAGWAHVVGHCLNWFVILMGVVAFATFALGGPNVFCPHDWCLPAWFGSIL